MFKKLISDAAMWQELSLLKEEVKALRNQQIKKDRDMEDLLYNLDSDNVPQLEGIVKRINLIVSGDGTAKAEFLIEAINGSSTVKIKADAIDLDGKVINLTTENVKIESENFSVDTEGNMACGNAKIRGSSTLCSDIDTTGANANKAVEAMRLGPDIMYESGNYVTESSAKMRLSHHEDVRGFPTYTRRIEFVSSIDRNKSVDGTDDSGRTTVHGGVVADVRAAGSFVYKDDRHDMDTNFDQYFVGLEMPALESDAVRGIIKVGEHALWLDEQGVLHTTASDIVFDDVL